MAGSALKFFLDNVKELLVYNAELLTNVRNEVEGLKEGLVLLQGFIIDSEENREINREQQAFVNSIMSFAEKAEDVIESFVVEKAKHRGRGNKIDKVLHASIVDYTIRKIAKEVRVLSIEIKGINLLQGEERFRRPSLRDNRTTTRKVLNVEEHDVVGFDNEAEEVINFLMNNSPEREVLGIVGMAGQGKTTLAKKVFKDGKIADEFTHRAWVSVSTYNCIEDVFISVLKKFEGIPEANVSLNLNNLDIETLVENMEICLKDKKYLVVLDDISWSNLMWNQLEIAFPRNNMGSRILLTTRLKSLAEHANDDKRSHILKFLSESESLLLLNKKIYGRGGCPSDLLRQAQLVANKCEGLPLAIINIASTLSQQRRVRQWWEQVAPQVNVIVNVSDKSNFNEVVAWGFNSLPYNKKLCFLYLGIFPRYPNIAVRDLTRLWIAEGFIPSETGMGLEDQAAAWLDDLVDMNLVMACSWGFQGRIKTCRVHNSLHSFCKFEAEKRRLYHEIDCFDPSTHSNYRRICLHKQVTEYISSKEPDKLVHTFITFPEHKMSLDKRLLEKMLKAFKRIRVLEVKSLEFTCLPNHYQELALLRYLAFSCDFKSIPSSISSLWSLQTLIISTSRRVLEFPKEIWKLYKLRHLQTTPSAILPSPQTSVRQKGSGVMQTLSSITPECCTVKVISKILNVKKLGVRGRLDRLLKDESKLIENLSTLKNLTNLKLFNESDPISKLSPKFPEKLIKLTLSGTVIAWEHMHILGALQQLQVLKLKDNAFKGDTWMVKKESFPSLRFLHIHQANLKIWEARDGQFLSLIRLDLQHCNELGYLPSCLENVQSFNTLNISYCSGGVVAYAKELLELKLKKGGLELTVFPQEQDS